MADGSNMSELGKWIKNIGTLLIGVATMIIGCNLNNTTTTITKMQMDINNNNAKTELDITRQGIENEQRLKSIEIFLELIKSDSLREKEMAVRLLRIIDKEMALNLALSIATNKSEDAHISLAAFRIGKQIDSGQFLEDILQTMNISLSDGDTGEVRGYLNKPDSGYQQLVEILFIALDRSALAGNKVPLNNINNSVLTAHGRRNNQPILEVNSFDPSRVRNAVFERWQEKNKSSLVNNFEGILY